MTSAENESLSAASPFDESGAWRRKPWAFAVCALLLDRGGDASVVGSSICIGRRHHHGDPVWSSFLGLQITFGMGRANQSWAGGFVGFGRSFYRARREQLGPPGPSRYSGRRSASALVSAAFAIPAARIKGFYLALTSLAAQVPVHRVDSEAAGILVWRIERGAGVTVEHLSAVCSTQTRNITSSP